MRKSIVLATMLVFLLPFPPLTASPEGGIPVPSTIFGMQSVPKFDERAGKGSWGGTRERGLRMHCDLGVGLSREGMIWMHYEPRPGEIPWQDDFDDAVAKLDSAGIAIEEMVTDTPFWASTAPNKNPNDPGGFKNAPPVGLNEPIFSDGTDRPGKGKKLNPRNCWAVFLDRIASRYRGKVRIYQVWNEPDFPYGDQHLDYSRRDRTWQGSVGQYVRLLRVAYVTIKRADPDALVATGGLGYPKYLAAILERNGGDSFDLLDFHAYGFPGSDRGLGEFLKVHASMKATLARHGCGKKRLICSETGYTALEGQEQADYILKLYATAAALGLDTVCYYTNINPSWKEMGLIDWETLSRPTPGYAAYKKASELLSGARYLGKAPLRPEAVGYRFWKGREFWIAWAPYREENQAISVSPSCSLCKHPTVFFPEGE